ncbi:MAG TPA: NADH-quinone oxidoreductase subunit C, partial [Quisquiliibacterium sp.]|nr:NADH-quinone oxidoreductase subunit C [Quisquiliibacterium sp.]
MTRLETLKTALEQAFGDRVQLAERLGEVTLVVGAADYLEVCKR